MDDILERIRQPVTPMLQYDEMMVFKAIENGNVVELEKLVVSDGNIIFLTDSNGKTIIHIAVQNGNANALRFAISCGVDMNAQDKFGNTAVHLAIELGCLECFDILICHGADIFIANRNQLAPIHLATRLNKLEFLLILLKEMKEYEVLIGGQQGRSCLHIAAICNFSECACAILNHCNLSPLSRTCDNGNTPIHEAARNSSAETLQTMLAWGEAAGLNRSEIMRYQDSEGNLPLHLAVHSGDITTVRVCLENGASISSKQDDLSTPVHLACSLGELDIVHLMFSVQPEEKQNCLDSCDVQQMTPLHYAALFDHTSIVEYLIEQGAHINVLDTEGRSPLLLAASRSAWTTVHYLLQNGADSAVHDTNCRNIIHYIVMNGGDLNEFTKIIDKSNLGQLLNEKDSKGCTPLHFSSRGGQIKCTENLLNLGACASLRDNENKSPLHFAARYGRYNTILELLRSTRGPCIINQADGIGQTALHIAAENGHTRIVQLLLAKGALLKRDLNGRNPLHLAAMNGYTQTMELLLCVHSHLLDQTDKDGNSPLHLATQENHPSAITKLLSKNCKFEQNHSNQTPIELAIVYRHNEAAMAMSTHYDRASEILRLNTESSEGVIGSLIAYMPEVFSAVLDSCITRSSDKRDSLMYFVKYSFKYLQYTREVEKELELKNPPLPAMNIMVKYRRLELLCHPICQKYIQMKWNAYGKYFHTTNLAIYLIFVAFLTTLAIRVMSLVDESNFINLEPGSSKTASSTLHNTTISSSAGYCIYALFVLTFAIINCAKELLQFYQQKLKYLLDPINFLESVLYVMSSIMAIPVLRGVISEYHLACAATAVFLAWFNLLLYLQRFDRVGIYVVMFLEILKTLLKALLIFSILVIAFGLSFYILLSRGNHLGFSNIPLSLIRVFTMMLGEFDFMGTFVQPYFNASPRLATLPFPQYSMGFLMIFMVFMPILLVNLLIGLAVGDIDSVRQNAYFKRLTMQVDLHTELERKLPKAWLRRIDKEEVVHYPNLAEKRCPSLWQFVQKWIGNVYTASTTLFESPPSADENAMLCAELHKQKTRMKEMSQTLTQLHQMVRLVVQKMEIQTEANYLDEGSLLTDKRRKSKWTSPSLAVKLKSVSALMRTKPMQNN